MIRRDIAPQWKNIAEWYWSRYKEGDSPQNPIWEMLEREHGATRTRPIGHPEWAVLEFPDEKSYTWFLLRWS